MVEPELHMNASDPDPLVVADRWCKEGRGVAVATVIATWGSSPRAGRKPARARRGGTLRGLGVGRMHRGAVIEQGIEAIRDRKPRVLDFGVSDERAWEVGLTCGGKVQVYVEPVED